MREFTVSIYMQIGVFSLLLMVAIAVVITSIIGTHLNSDIALLTEHDAAMKSGMSIADHQAYSIPSIRSHISNLRWITYLTVGGTLAVLCVGIFTMIWLGARTISHQTQEIKSRVSELSALNNLMQQHLKVEENQNQRQEPFTSFATNGIFSGRRLRLSAKRPSRLT